MSIYLTCLVGTFLISIFLSVYPSPKSKMVSKVLSILIYILGIAISLYELLISKEGKCSFIGFSIPALAYFAFPLPIIILLNTLTIIYLLNMPTNKNIVKKDILLIALISLHNFLLSALLFVKELITLFFLLEFLSVVNLGFIISSNTPQKKEVALKYFTQNIFASILYIVGAIFYFKNNQTLELLPTYQEGIYAQTGRGIFTNFANIEYLLFFIFFFKLGIFPFHSWVSDTFETIDKNIYPIFFSIQKGVLIFILSQFSYIFAIYRTSNEFLFMMSIVIFITLLISIIGATGTPKLSRFFGFSSIYNATFIVGLLISWMQENPNIQYENIFFVSYIFSIFYTISTFVLFSIVEKAGVSSFEDIYYIPSNLRFYWLFFVANFIPFPLLLGFFAKLGIFIEIFKNGMSHIGVLFALSSVLAMYFYTRLLPIKEVPHSQNIPTSSMFRLCIFVLTTTFLIINLFLTKAYQLFTTLYKISLPYF